MSRGEQDCKIVLSPFHYITDVLVLVLSGPPSGTCTDWTGANRPSDVAFSEDQNLGCRAEGKNGPSWLFPRLVLQSTIVSFKLRKTRKSRKQKMTQSLYRSILLYWVSYWHWSISKRILYSLTVLYKFWLRIEGNSYNLSQNEFFCNVHDRGRACTSCDLCKKLSSDL